ncbi:MAG: hypothetical protein WCF67_08330 [Chitinophagaceae bacterium]
MKSKFYLFLLVASAAFASCTKSIPDVQQNIVGNWEIVAVDRQTSYGYEPYYTPYQNGTFYFSNNGNAQYEDNIGQMTGSWRMVQRSGYANNSLELRLYDYYNDDAIEWEFYSIEMSGSRMVGYMNRYGYEYRYEFRRY